jgi:hypothetical protein
MAARKPASRPPPLSAATPVVVDGRTVDETNVNWPSEEAAVMAPAARGSPDSWRMLS